MHKLSKTEVEALQSIQGKPFGFVADKVADKLIAAGLAVATSIQVGSDEDAEGKTAINCTLAGLSFGKVNDAPPITQLEGGDSSDSLSDETE